MRAHYEVWGRAHKDISWERFLEKLDRMHETGMWVKEVIKIELKK